MREPQLGVLALAALALLGFAVDASAESVIFEDGFESGRLCAWSSHPCGEDVLLEVLDETEQDAADLVNSSSCTPPSSDTEVMTRLVAMALLQRMIRDDDSIQ